MSLVAGIDPGANGAIAVYDTGTMRLIGMHDMPVWFMTVGKRQRKRIDPVALMEIFDTLNMMGVELVVLESVGGRPGQSASAGFVFGYSVGVIYMCCMYCKLMTESIPPSQWKKIMNVTGKAKGTDDDIMNRADELFPHDREYFRGAKGGKKLDRAEAAMLAKFGGEYVLRTMKPDRIKDDTEFKLALRNVDTGA